MSDIKDKDRFGQRMVLPKGSVVFTHLDKPDTGHKFSSNKYDCTIIFPRDSKGIAKVIKDVNAFAKSVLGNTDGLIPITDGASKKQAYYKGYWVVKGKCSKKPSVEDENGDTVSEADIKTGMPARLMVTPYAYGDGDGGVTGVSFILQGMRVYMNEEPLDIEVGKGESATSAFDEVDDIDE